MNSRRWPAIVVVVLAAACNNSSSTVDSRTDLPPGDLPKGDLRGPDRQKDREGIADRRTTDLPVVDQRQSLEGIKADKKASQDQKVTPDLPADPCAGITCGLLNDCCDCYATNGPPPGICKMLCKQNTCDALGIKPQVTYCVGGHCLVTAGATSCNADTDCQRIDNCCDCLSLPKTASAPDCQKLCLISTCVSRGLATTKVRCILGECRLQK